MNEKPVYTRQDAVSVSGLSARQIDTIEKYEIIKPYKPHIRACLYTYTQLVELRFIAKMRETFSLQQIRQLRKNLEEINFDIKFLYNKNLVVTENEVFLITEDEDVLMKVNGKDYGQLTIKQFVLIYCKEIIKDLNENRCNKIVDFDKKRKESTGIMKIKKAS